MSPFLPLLRESTVSHRAHPCCTCVHSAATGRPVHRPPELWNTSKTMKIVDPVHVAPGNKSMAQSYDRWGEDECCCVCWSIVQIGSQALCRVTQDVLGGGNLMKCRLLGCHALMLSEVIPTGVGLEGQFLRRPGDAGIVGLSYGRPQWGESIARSRMSSCWRFWKLSQMSGVRNCGPGLPQYRLKFSYTCVPRSSGVRHVEHNCICSPEKPWDWWRGDHGRKFGFRVSGSSKRIVRTMSWSISMSLSWRAISRYNSTDRPQRKKHFQTP